MTLKKWVHDPFIVGDPSFFVQVHEASRLMFFRFLDPKHEGFPLKDPMGPNFPRFLDPKYVGPPLKDPKGMVSIEKIYFEFSQTPWIGPWGSTFPM